MSEQSKSLKVGNLVLVGMPGAGKSTVGVVLAKILNKSFVDVDLLIQSQYEKTLQAMIDEMGAEGFIQAENSVLTSVMAENSVVSTGGSAVYSDEGMAHMAEIGTIIYLEIAFETLVLRLSDLDERGVVMKSGASMSLRELFEEREPLYRKYADVVVNVDDLSITAAARKVASTVEG